MLSHLNTKNANYLFIMSVLKEMLSLGSITPKEYLRAKGYYLQLTGADIVLAEEFFLSFPHNCVAIRKRCRYNVCCRPTGGLYHNMIQTKTYTKTAKT